MSVKSIKPTPSVKSIADKLIEKIIIRLGDGTEWAIILTCNVLCEFEKMTGLDITFGSTEFMNSMTNTRALLYLCLREQGAQYSLEEVGALMTGKLTLIKFALHNAMANSLVQKEDAAQLEMLTEKLTGELKAAS